jgi:biopolymer transport protein TolQ
MIVLIILLGLSVLSWALILSKHTAMRRLMNNSIGFLSHFRAAAGLDDIRKIAERFRPSPLVEIFLAGHAEIAQLSDNGLVEIKGLSTVERAIKQSAVAQMAQLEQGVGWLASIGTSSPFIGLFGTVVGIIIAFQGLSTQSQTSIQAVAPGIAEALVATAMGLFAAVPAYMAYNYFVNRIKLISTMMDEFALEFLNLAEKSMAQYGLYRS